MSDMSNDFIIDLPTLEDTLKVAGCLAPLLQAGDTLALCGEPGAGKTTFTKLLLARWGIMDVISPTFTLHHSFSAAFTVHHLDLYRLDSPEELYQLGWEEMMDGSSLVVVEWMDKFPSILPPDYLMLNFTYAEEGRCLGVSASGPRGITLWEAMRICVVSGF